jgi:Cu(I)-responsive transcriptional regulator
VNIGEAAKRSGLTTKTIRFYEDIGLVSAAGRDPNGYRRYGEHEVNHLRFVHRARSLGFTVDECRELLALYGDRARASADVKALAVARIRDIERKIAELEVMKATLEHLAERCHGDERPHCPILEDLAASADAES